MDSMEEHVVEQNMKILRKKIEDQSVVELQKVDIK
jgi:hypothetical protein